MTGTQMSISYNYSSYTMYQTTGKKANNTSFSDKVDEKGIEAVQQESQRGSVMSDYYAKKPEYKAVQEKRVQGGYTVLSSAGISADDIEEMSVSEFREKMSTVIGNIPHHTTRPYDEETVMISEEGWENMKKDPNYAAWVVGYLKEDRSVSNPFFALGDKGCFCIQSFGASPAEYHGHSYSKIYGGTAAGARSMYNAECGKGGITTRAPQADAQPPADYNLWEEQRKIRRRKQKELLDEEIQAKYEQRKRLNEYYEKKYYNQKALQRSLGSAEMLKTKGTALSMQHLPAGVAASYEASFLTVGVPEFM